MAFVGTGGYALFFARFTAAGCGAIAMTASTFMIFGVFAFFCVIAAFRAFLGAFTALFMLGVRGRLG